MALVKCGVCGGQVSTEAPTCPHCGADGPGEEPAAAVRVDARSTDRKGPNSDSSTAGAARTRRPKGALWWVLGLLWFLTVRSVFMHSDYVLEMVLFLMLGLGVAALLGLALGKATKAPSRPFLPAVAVQLTQGLWIAAAGVSLGHVRSEAPHAAALLFGALWLWLWPGRLVVSLLSVYQGAAFAQQIVAYVTFVSRHGEGSAEAMLASLVVMMMIRLTAVILMVGGLDRAAREAAAQADLETGIPEVLTWDEVTMLIDQARDGTLCRSWPSAQDEPPGLDAARWEPVLRDVDFKAAQRALREMLSESQVDAFEDPGRRVCTREYALALARFLAEPSPTAAARLLEASPPLQELFEQSKPGGIWTH